MHTIDSFSGTYDFLSNFAPSPIKVELNGKTYLMPTVENAFQAAKCPNRADEFVNLTPGQAKRLGRKVTLVNNWNDIRIDVMAAFVEKKFRTHENLRQKLLNTGDATLIEGNYWHDCFWGVCDGVGENHLGQILMTLREKLRSEEA